MSVTIRPARGSDRAAVKSMLGEFVDYLNAIEPSEDEADLDYLVEQAFGPDAVCTTLIAEQDGVAVGYIAFHPGVWEIWRSLYVISLFVRAEARGGGAGRALIDAVKAIAREQQAKRLTWEVWSKNPLAIEFYRRIGGTVYEENLRMSLAVD
jgi:GNAT superfamily N-acetyltransferase